MSWIGHILLAFMVACLVGMLIMLMLCLYWVSPLLMVGFLVLVAILAYLMHKYLR